MNRYLPIKIDTCSHEYMIDLCGNTWTNSGLPVSNMILYHGNPSYFRLHICELMKYGDKDIRIVSEYAFVTGKKVTVDFMGKTYHPGDSDYELTRLHNALETELALARLEVL